MTNPMKFKLFAGLPDEMQLSSVCRKGVVMTQEMTQPMTAEDARTLAFMLGYGDANEKMIRDAGAVCHAYADILDRQTVDREEVDRLREALAIIGKQLLPDEMEPGSGCFESGYTAVICAARQALGDTDDQTG